MAYATYAYYTGTYLGTAIASADFARLANRASAVIDQRTYDRTAAIVLAATETATIDKIAMATCALAEVIQTLESSGGAIQSETIGRHSVTYAVPHSESARLAKAAKLYMGSTGLMYPGFASGEYSGEVESED